MLGSFGPLLKLLLHFITWAKKRDTENKLTETVEDAILLQKIQELVTTKKTRTKARLTIEQQLRDDKLRDDDGFRRD